MYIWRRNMQVKIMMNKYRKLTYLIDKFKKNWYLFLTSAGVGRGSGFQNSEFGFGLHETATKHKSIYSTSLILLH